MEDKIFLLSIDEFDAYVRGKSFLKMKMTKYDTGHQGWWLRSPNHRNDYAVYVIFDVNIISIGGNVDYDDNAVCPAFQVTQEEFGNLKTTKKDMSSIAVLSAEF